ncbi:S-layer homology domain-containing protein [Desulfuribacillus alkaliarsenatis]|uniref:Parasporal protein n=1 Tax=Desulfuribacillus alkaliarsenatis TaxID=766136 RepID=A0A1E5G2D7_9FIRM|nr:S-layer homology domain-containing protein [Desulfuribacillus alkaliarsenatis]OEF97104.1 Parasporal protein [Desulfuribacillus alkaliarsenatis]
MSKFLRYIIAVTIIMSLLPLNIYAETFSPTPQEDRINGRNNNAYMPSTTGPTLAQQEAFVNQIAKYAVDANEQWGIPASAIIGMAILESGYGTTRIAHFANNIFGIKVWGFNPANAWQLQGQPDEDFAREIPVIANLGNDRIIFDETQRRDNWYRMFSSYEDAVNFLAGTLLLNNRYGFARDNYQKNIKSGWSLEDASKQFLFEVANAGYNHLGGDYYRRTIGNLMDRWDLYQYDAGYHLRDIRGHKAETSIRFASENQWMTGHNDGTFKPDSPLTRAEAATVIINYLDLVPTDELISFTDVSLDHWGIESIKIVAQNGIMIGTSEKTFSPSTVLTRAQVAQILYNAGLYNETLNKDNSNFIDVPDDFWGLTAIETMRNAGFVNGYGDGTFRPNQPITRAEMAIILKNVYENY